MLEIAALVVAGLSAIAAVLGWLSAHRSANAAQRSAYAAERSSAAEQRAAEVAEREEQQRIADRHEEGGPDFKQEGIGALREAPEVRLRMRGGPEKMRLRILCPDISSVAGVSWYNEAAPKEISEPGLELIAAHVSRESLVTFRVHLSRGPWAWEQERTLPLTIEATSYEKPARIWTRVVSVRLKRSPRVHGF